MRTVPALSSLLLAPTAAVAAASAVEPLANAPVSALDLQCYAGTWHEIAHLPMVFQRQCVADITAT